MKVGILARWAAGSLAVFVSLAASNFYAVWKLHQLGATTIPSVSAEIRILDCKKKLVDFLFLQLSCERKYLLLKDAGLHDQFLEASREFHRYAAQGLLLADTAAKRGSFRSIEALQKRYETLVEAEVSRVRKRRSYDASKYGTEKDTASDAVLQELNNLENYAWHDVNRKIGMVSEAGASTLRIAAWSSLITILCALLMSFFVTKSVTSPLKRLVGKTREISAGVFKGDLEIKSPPEISELTKAFNTMCEKLTVVDRMKGDFLSMISHELRTPLTTIKEGTSLLREGIGGEITEKQGKLLFILSEETDRLIEMVNSILDLSKMEAGMMTYAFEERSIVPLIDQVMTEVTPLVEAKGILLQKEIGGDLAPPRLDRDRMLQTLRNLIGNAVKFTPESGRITVTARRASEGLEVAVEDSGPGIPAEKLATVFEKFSGSDRSRGTGLGLAIVKHVIDMHGGKVWAESTPGKGSRFIFVLPS